MSNPKLKADIETLLDKAGFFVEDGGQPFRALTQSDLMSGLREIGWSLPAAGWFLSDVRTEGYEARQAYQFKGKVRRHYEKSYSRTQRSMSDYQTLIFMKGEPKDESS